MTIPCDLPYGRKEIVNLEAYILSRLPKGYKPFGPLDTVGLGCQFHTSRGISNRSITWYWSKIRRAFLKLNLIYSSDQTYVLYARIFETSGNPFIEIELLGESYGEGGEVE